MELLPRLRLRNRQSVRISHGLVVRLILADLQRSANNVTKFGFSELQSQRVVHDLLGTCIFAAICVPQLVAKRSDHNVESGLQTIYIRSCYVPTS